MNSVQEETDSSYLKESHLRYQSIEFCAGRDRFLIPEGIPFKVSVY